MSELITLRTLATKLAPLSKDNYRIEKAKPSETAAYEKLKTYDQDQNNYIDIQEFRNYYLSGLLQTSVPVAINDARCQAADTLLNATETSDPQALAAAYSYLVSYDTTLTEIMKSIALDKTQPNIRQFFNALTLYTQGISEDDWDGIISEILLMGKAPEEPAGAIYALDFLYSEHRYFPGDASDIEQSICSLQQALSSPSIHNTPLYMQKALRTLCVLDKTAGANATISYVLEQLGKPLPPYEHLSNILYDNIYGLKEQSIPFALQLFRLTTDRTFHGLLRQLLTELYTINAYSAAAAALTELNNLTIPEATPGHMVNTLLNIGGNNPDLIIERKLPSETAMYEMLAKYDIDHNGLISVPEYKTYYLEKTAPTGTLALFSDRACLYLQDLFSTTPTIKIIEQGAANEETGESLIGHNLDYAEFTQQTMKNILANIARDKTRPGLTRLAAIQNLLNYLSFTEGSLNTWSYVLFDILRELGTQKKDPLTTLATGYYMVCQRFQANFIFAPGEEITTTGFQKYITFLEQLKLEPKIKSSPELIKKLDELLASVKEYL